MNYFNKGCILLLKDFSDFCKECNEDFDVDYVNSLIKPFLQSRQTMQNTEVETSSTGAVIPEKSSKTKPVIRKTVATEGAAPKGGSKNTEISVDEFNKLSIKEIKNPTWYSKILVSTLKDLCTKLSLPVTRLTKTQIIDNLIQYKIIQNQNDNETPIEEDEVPEPSTQKPKRRVLASAIVKPAVTITKRHNLNLVFCDKEGIILVLSDNHRLDGFIPKEEYDEDDIPNVCKVTKDVICVAKNMDIAYDVPETI